MAEHPDILIIGGGVIGLTTAYFLAREGIRVEVVDKGELGQESSWAGAGILPPGNPETASTPFDRVRAQSVAMFPALAVELRERTGIDTGYSRCGGLEFVGEAHDAAAQEWRGEGIRFEMLDDTSLQHLEPAVASGLGSVCHIPDMAQLRNPRHIKALLSGCQSLGVRLTAGCPVHGFERKGDHITGVKTCLGPLRANRFLLATGAWTDTLLELVGWEPGIHPVRGQIALLHTESPLFRHILLHGASYVVPRPDGRVLIGSTEEYVGFEKRNTARAIAELLELGCKLVPALADANLERTWSGLRPGSPDGLPFIGPVPGIINLVVAAGHFRAGIQLSLATAVGLKEMLLDQPLSLPFDAFRLDRA